MAKRNRTQRRKDQFFSDNYWQSAAFNQRAFAKNLDIALALAMNRFRWHGLPDTCDARYLELQLHKLGIATIARHPDTGAWVSVMATLSGDVDMYGLPITWQAIGQNGRANFPVKAAENGELVFYSNTRVNPWNALEMYARKLTHYERTEDINLTHQHTPWVLIAPQEKRQEIINLYKQIDGGEPAIIGDGRMLDMVSKIQAVNTGVPFIGEELALARQNVFNQMLLYLGIPHLAFEKGERMIEDEARANTAPTNVMLMNCLQARRDAVKKLSKLSADFRNVEVVYNDDLESYNFNYEMNTESLAQDGMIAPIDIDGGLEE